MPETEQLDQVDQQEQTGGGDDNLKILHETVGKKYDLGSLEDFSKKMQDPANRKAFHNTVGKEYDLGSYDEFENRIGVKKKESGVSASSATNATASRSPALASPAQSLDEFFTRQGIKTDAQKLDYTHRALVENSIATLNGLVTDKKIVQPLARQMVTSNVTDNMQGQFRTNMATDNTANVHGHQQAALQIVKGGYLPIAQQDIDAQETAIQHDPVVQRKALTLYAAKHPEEAPKIQQSLYSVDAMNRATTPEQKQKIVENAVKIASGELKYTPNPDPTKPGQLIKPENIGQAISTSWENRNKTMDMFDLVGKGDDNAVIKALNDKIAHDNNPDNPKPTPTGFLGGAGEFLGGQGKVLMGTAAALPLELIPGAGEFLHSAVTSGLFAAEMGRSGYVNELQRSYAYYKQQGMKDEDALLHAKSTAVKSMASDVALGGMMGFVGKQAEAAKSLTGDATKGILQKAWAVAKRESAGAIGEIPTAIKLGTTAASGEVAKNLMADQKGREAMDGTGDAFENMAMLHLVSHTATSLLAGGLREGTGMYKKVSGLLGKLPEADRQAVVKEQVDNGQITPEQGQSVLDQVKADKEMDDQITDNVKNPDVREKMIDLMKKRDEVKGRIQQVDEALHPGLKEKVKEINGKIAELADSPEAKVGPVEDKGEEPATDNTTIGAGVDTAPSPTAKWWEPTTPGKRIIEPSKPISQMNSEELYQHAVDVKKALKAQDKEFANKSEDEKEKGGYYDVIDNTEELRDASTRVNYIENAENIHDLAGSTKSAVRGLNKEKPSEESLAILNAAQKRAKELGISTNDLIKEVIKRVGNDYKDPEDAAFMMKNYLEKMATDNTTTGAGVDTAPSPITPEADALLKSLDEGSKPAFVTKNLEKIAADNGIEVTDKSTPDDIINALKEKANPPEVKEDVPPSVIAEQKVSESAPPLDELIKQHTPEAVDDVVKKTEEAPISHTGEPMTDEDAVNWLTHQDKENGTTSDPEIQNHDSGKDAEGHAVGEQQAPGAEGGDANRPVQQVNDERAGEPAKEPKQDDRQGADTGKKSKEDLSKDFDEMLSDNSYDSLKKDESRNLSHTTGGYTTEDAKNYVKDFISKQLEDTLSFDDHEEQSKNVLESVLRDIKDAREKLHNTNTSKIAEAVLQGARNNWNEIKDEAISNAEYEAARAYYKVAKDLMEQPDVIRALSYGNITPKSVEAKFYNNPSPFDKLSSGKGETTKTPFSDYVKKGQSVLNSLFPDHKIIVHDTTDEYAATGRSRNSAGVFNPDTKTITLNRELIEKTNSGNTVFHEVIHPIVREALESRPEAVNDAYSKLVALQKEPGMDAVWKHEDQYRDRGIGTVKVEAITEFLSLVADGKIDPSKLSKDLSTKIIDVVNRIFKALGIDKVITTASDLKVLTDTIKKAFDGDVKPLTDALGKKAELASEQYDKLVTPAQEHLDKIVKWVARHLNSGQDLAELTDVVKSKLNITDVEAKDLIEQAQDQLHTTTAKKFILEGRTDAQIQEYLKRKGIPEDRALAIIGDAKQNPIDPETKLHELDEAKKIYFGKEDAFLGNKELNKVDAAKEARDFQDRTKESLKGDKSMDNYNYKDVDRAIHLYNDSRGLTPEELKEFRAKIDPITHAKELKAFDLSRKLNDKQKAIADEQKKQYDAVGKMAMDNEIIDEVKEHYVARSWDMQGKSATEVASKFATSTKHSMQRTLGSILQGYAEGMHLKVEGASNNLATLKVELGNVIENRKLLAEGMKIKTADGTPLFVTHPMSGYERIDSPSFKKWEYAGKIEDHSKEEAQVLGKRKDIVIGEDGTVMKKSDVYAPTDVAKSLNHLFVSGKPTGIEVFNQAVKQSMLSFSGFHYLAFSKAHLLSTLRIRDMNPITAYRSGIKTIAEHGRPFRILVEEGLTINRKQDFDESISHANTKLGDLLDKNAFTGAAKDKMLELNHDLHRHLFETYGAGLKAFNALKMWDYEMKKNPGADERAVARSVAKITNDTFGGINWQRDRGSFMHNPLYRRAASTLMLAPDWTFSNIRFAKKAFDGGFEGKLYRSAWARVILRGAAISGIAGAIMATVPDDEEDKHLTMEQRFTKRYKQAWDDGRLRTTMINISPLYHMLGGDKDKHAYFSIFGAYADPIKLFQDPMAFADAKLSFVTKVPLEAYTGTNWQHKQFTSLDELAGMDDKGVYSKTQTAHTTNDINEHTGQHYKRNQKGYTAGEQKGGKLKGQFTKWPTGLGHGIYKSQLPSFIGAQMRGMMPSAIQNIWQIANGENDLTTGLLNSAGTGVLTNKVKK